MTSLKASPGASSGAALPPCHSAKRDAGRVDHLERAHDALRIGGAEARRHGRIARGKLVMQGVAAKLIGSLPPIGSDLGGNVRDRRQPLGQRLEIEAGAADQDRQPPLPLRFGDRAADIAKPAADGIGLRRRHGAVEAMGHARLVGLARPRREQAKLAIDLHGIGVDDRAAEAGGKLEASAGFPARGRSCDQDGLDRHG